METQFQKTYTDCQAFYGGSDMKTISDDQFVQYFNTTCPRYRIESTVLEIVSRDCKVQIFAFHSRCNCYFNNIMAKLLTHLFSLSTSSIEIEMDITFGSGIMISTIQYNVLQICFSMGSDYSSTVFPGLRHKEPADGVCLLIGYC